MRASIIIPVWSGAAVIADCLDSVYAQTGDELPEVICVDNASRDESAPLIAERYPQVRLIQQPVNLGFAGGVNAGMEAAQGDVFVLLNQDCVIHAGWLDALDQALQMHPQIGIAGCTILNADGAVNHTGALLRRPGAYGVHLTEIGDSEVRSADFVTGAAVAIRRQTWDEVGRFDEGYYPGYYEDIDYCYRARSRGFEIAYVPKARATHLFSSHEWQADPIKHTANQHRSRYRFMSKHFDSSETRDFFEAEYAESEAEVYFDQAVGRVLAARDTLRGLPDIVERRRADLGDVLSTAHRRQLLIGFTEILRRSFAVADRLSQAGLIEPPLADWQSANQRLQEALSTPVVIDLPAPPEQQTILQQLEDLRQRELDLLARIHLRPPSSDQAEPTLRRIFRKLVMRPLSFLLGRENRLLSELGAVHTARMDQIQRLAYQVTHVDQLHRAGLAEAIALQNTRMEQINQLYRDRTKQNELLFRYHQEQARRRLDLLRILADYDYR